MSRHRSTICREYARNKAKGYHYSVAEGKLKIRGHVKSSKLESNSILRLIVCTLLNECASPEVVFCYLKQNFPDDLSMQISHNSIYQWIYTDLLPKGVPGIEENLFGPGQSEVDRTYLLSCSRPFIINFAHGKNSSQTILL